MVVDSQRASLLATTGPAANTQIPSPHQRQGAQGRRFVHLGGYG